MFGHYPPVGTELLKSMEFSVMRALNLSFFMLMRWRGRPVGPLRMEAGGWGPSPVIRAPPSSREGRGAGGQTPHQWPMTLSVMPV